MRRTVTEQSYIVTDGNGQARDPKRALKYLKKALAIEQVLSPFSFYLLRTTYVTHYQLLATCFPLFTTYYSLRLLLTTDCLLCTTYCLLTR